MQTLPEAFLRVLMLLFFVMAFPAVFAVGEVVSDFFSLPFQMLRLVVFTCFAQFAYFAFEIVQALFEVVLLVIPIAFLVVMVLFTVLARIVGQFVSNVLEFIACLFSRVNQIIVHLVCSGEAQLHLAAFFFALGGFEFDLKLGHVEADLVDPLGQLPVLVEQ